MKKMIMAALAVLTLSPLANAAPRQVPKEQMGTYVKFLTDAISTLYCSQGGSVFVGNIVRAAQTMTTDSSGAQPAITATYVSSVAVAQDVQQVVRITTSTDQKSILGIVVTEYDLRTVNQGTLVNPQPGQAWVPTIVSVCSK